MINRIMFTSFLLLPIACFAQIADVANQNTVSIGAGAGSRISGSVDFRAESWGVAARNIGHQWDAGGTYRFLRYTDQVGDTSRYADLGATVLYGSDGPKGAVAAGLLAGDSEQCFFWARGMLGNFRAASAGARIGRVDLSGLWSSYFESKIEARVFLSWTQKLSISVGYSTAMGLSAGLQKAWGWK